MKWMLFFSACLALACNIKDTSKKKLADRSSQRVCTKGTVHAVYEVQYLPGYQEMLKQRAGAVPATTVTDTSQSSFSYFRFSMQFPRAIDDKGLIEYMNYRMQPDLLLAGAHRDSIACVFYQAIPKGNSRSYEFLVAFELPIVPGAMPDTALQFVFKDAWFGTGPIVFDYLPKVLVNVPKIRLNEKG